MSVSEIRMTLTQLWWEPLALPDTSRFISTLVAVVTLTVTTTTTAAASVVVQLPQGPATTDHHHQQQHTYTHPRYLEVIRPAVIPANDLAYGVNAPKISSFPGSDLTVGSSTHGVINNPKVTSFSGKRDYVSKIVFQHFLFQKIFVKFK